MASRPPAVAPTAYHRLLESRAPTLSGSSAIQYALLTDPEHAEVFLLITAAEGGGNFNREVVGIDALEAVVDAAPAGKPFGSKQLKGGFTGRSNNNAPYACAALIAQGLLAKSPDAKFGLVKAGDWDAWRLEMMALPGEPFLFPPQSANAPIVPTPEPNKARKKDRRGGNRFVPVVPENEASTESPTEEVHDADPA
ncbi:MAG: hypothetical protein JSR83_23220 [Proteobacteria bacterium]|nr:hypothetical protein [Pseudomonadota bacterium]